MMKRTQIYFPKNLYKQLKIGAKINEISLSAYIRKLLKEKIYKTKEKIKIPKKQGDLTIIAKNAINLGPADLAENFDKYFENSL